MQAQTWPLRFIPDPPVICYKITRFYHKQDQTWPLRFISGLLVICYKANSIFNLDFRFFWTPCQTADILKVAFFPESAVSFSTSKKTYIPNHYPEKSAAVATLVKARATTNESDDRSASSLAWVRIRAEPPLRIAF